MSEPWKHLFGQGPNVLPGMEAAFVDIATPKMRCSIEDVTYDREDLDGDKSQSSLPKPKKQRSCFSRKQDYKVIEDLLKAHQSILCQVTKNPIAHKGARLSTEVSLPGRFVVLVPNSDTYGISKRLGDRERKRLRASRQSKASGAWSHCPNRSTRRDRRDRARCSRL